jgi:CSLREA domain-containing protein
MKKDALKTIQTVLLLISLVLIIIIPVRVGQAAPEASIEVTTTEDDFGSDLAYCSLREAVQAAFVAGNFGGCINP